MQTSGPQRNRRIEYSWLLDVEQLLSEQLVGGVSDDSDSRSKLNSPRFVANSRPCGLAPSEQAEQPTQAQELVKDR
jgi:hypothetical protein